MKEITKYKDESVYELEYGDKTKEFFLPSAPWMPVELQIKDYIQPYDKKKLLIREEEYYLYNIIYYILRDMNGQLFALSDYSALPSCYAKRNTKGADKDPNWQPEKDTYCRKNNGIIIISNSDETFCMLYKEAQNISMLDLMRITSYKQINR